MPWVQSAIVQGTDAPLGEALIQQNDNIGNENHLDAR